MGQLLGDLEGLGEAGLVARTWVDVTVLGGRRGEARTGGGDTQRQILPRCGKVEAEISATPEAEAGGSQA